VDVSKDSTQLQVGHVIAVIAAGVYLGERFMQSKSQKSFKLRPSCIMIRQCGASLLDYGYGWRDLLGSIGSLLSPFIFLAHFLSLTSTYLFPAAQYL
jgi:hypothetical protein